MLEHIGRVSNAGCRGSAWCCSVMRANAHHPDGLMFPSEARTDAAPVASRLLESLKGAASGSRPTARAARPTNGQNFTFSQTQSSDSLDEESGGRQRPLWNRQ